MIVDDTLVLSNNQAITATAASTNIIDLGLAGTPFGHAAGVRRDVGIATEIPLYIAVNTSFNNLTSLSITLQVDEDVAFGSPTTVAVGNAIPLASLVAGYSFGFPAELPEGSNERYLRLLYTVVGTAPSAGKIFASVVAARQTN